MRGLGALEPLRVVGIGDPILVESDNPRAVLRRALRRSSETMAGDLDRMVEVFLHSSYVLDRDHASIDRLYAMEALQRVVRVAEGDLMAIGTVDRSSDEAQRDYRAYRTLERYRADGEHRPLDAAERRLFERAIHRLSRRPRSGLNASTGGRRIVRTLHAAWRSETDSDLRSSLATAVADAMTIQTFEDLRTHAVLGTDPRTQQEAYRVLRRLAGPRIIPQLLFWMGDGSGGLRPLSPPLRQLVIDLCAAARGPLLFRKFATGPSAAEALRSIAADETDPDLQVYAESALARVFGTTIGDQEAWIAKFREELQRADEEQSARSAQRIQFEEVSW
ncbi:MAG: hypothetical protein AAF196_19660 [Planctomycetota bacterium]